MKIPFSTFSVLHQEVRSEMIEAFTRVYDKGWFIQGEECTKFENEFAAYCNRDCCVGVANEWTWIGIFGDLFVGALKALAPVLVFFLISSAIGKATAGIGKRFRTVVILYMVTTFTAAIVSVIASYAFPITFTLADAAVDMAPPGNLGEVFKTLLSISYSGDSAIYT